MEVPKTPLFDAALDSEERLDWLMQALSLEEKLSLLATLTPPIPRLHIGKMYLGGEASHGVEAKHDRKETWGSPVRTVSYPLPIAMGQTWNEPLAEEVGAAVAAEARALFAAEGGQGGLCRWAPMAEPARDARWGRLEESYSEDPLLAGRMASSYIRGMQGEDPDHLRLAATARYFFGASRELPGARASIDPRSAYEYYMEPYRICVNGGVEALMVADCSINGIPALLHPLLRTLVRGEWHFSGHICGSENGLKILCGREGYTDAANTLSLAVAAGVDCFADDPAFVSAAAKEAYARSLLPQEALNRAVRNTFRTRLRLGMFDGEGAGPPAEEPARENALAYEAAVQSVVLLKNEEGLLPLTVGEGSHIAVIGPLADVWWKDWSGPLPEAPVAVLSGIREAFPGCAISFTDGSDRVLLRVGEHYLRLTGDRQLCLGSRAEAEELVVTDWGEGRLTLQCSLNSAYLGSVDETGRLFADREQPYGREVKEVFLAKEEGDAFTLTTWCGEPLFIDPEGLLRAHTSLMGEVSPVRLVREMAWDGLARARQLAAEADTAVLVLGRSPMIGGKIGEDRGFMGLPAQQQSLARLVAEANARTALVLIGNGPFAMEGLEDIDIPAILYTPSGAQALGQAVAALLSGAETPTGHLAVTWYEQPDRLPPLDDYTVVGRRGYRYPGASVRYPFGYGLSYTAFTCEAFAVEQKEDGLLAALCMRNTGNRPGVFVAQLYAARDDEEAGIRESSRLVGFARLPLAPGEAKEAVVAIPKTSLLVYDVVTESMVLREGSYRIWLGESAAQCCMLSEEEAAECELFLPGDIRLRRDLANITGAWLYDEARNIELMDAGGMTAVRVKDPAEEALLIYRQVDASSIQGDLWIRLFAADGARLSIEIAGEDCGEYTPDTAGLVAEEPFLLPIALPPQGEEPVSICLRMRGNMGICSFYMA